VKIYLVGFMGAGKTTVGRLLAARLGYPFVDLDQEIERDAGQSVREIFESEGEVGFRAREWQRLETVRRLPAAVVATGGGTVAQPGARSAMVDGLVIWLNPPFATIAQRIGVFGKAERPLFRDEAQAMDLYRQRLDAYRSADLRFDTRSDESAEETTSRIELALRQRGISC
jgi:shikimate kinase